MARKLAAIVVVLTALAARSAPLADVPVVVRHGQVIVSAKVNGSEPLNFLLDTGFSMSMLRPDVADKLKLKRVGEITVEGIAGEERVATYEGPEFDVGGARFSPRRIGGMAGTRRQRDGIIGSSLFRQFVVEVDPAASRLRIYDPATFEYAGKGEVVPLRFRRSTPIVDALVFRTNGEPIKAAFEVDTGCDSGICIGSDFSRTNGFLEAFGKNAGGKYGVGGGATTRSGHLPRLQLGKLQVEQPQADFFVEGSPVDRGLAGHIGMGVLSNYHTWFDYSRQRLILESRKPAMGTPRQ